ncbi:MAG: ClbS/DfsB family four-helix bundle protein [Kiloniellales bacterium]
MPATTRVELLAVTEKEYGKLMKTLEDIEADVASVPGPEEGVSIKDTVAHRAHWLDLFLGWYSDGKAGKTVQTPAPGYKWNQLKDYNEKVRQASRNETWPDILERFQGKHTELLALLNKLDETELYEPSRYGWTNDWTLGRWAEASGASHYRSANKFIRKTLRSL